MSSSSTQLAALRGMGIYEPFHQMNSWGDAFRNDTGVNIGSSTIIQMDGESDKIECVSHELGEPSRSDQEANRVPDKIQRRLAQNREAARKSRLRKKAYVQQLESSRLKLEQLEQELERARQQGLYRGSVSDSSHLGLPATRNSDGISAFEIGYGFWVEEQYKQVTELRNALQVHITDVELRILVENGLNHYNNLFQMKAEAAKADVFYLISGKWKTSVERFFLWIGGFRPSELLQVLMSQLEPLTEQQVADINHLRQSSQQAEDALSQGIEKLQQNLAQSLAADLKEDAGSFRVRMGGEIEKLEALEGFVNQADHLRQQTLQQMYRILTTHQAARGLLALGEYFYRLRALSSLWAARPRDAS